MTEQINKENFENLLSGLDDNRDSAGVIYVELRENLTKFFTWRGFSEAELYADETLNRAARKVSENEAIEDFRKYIFGIARLLCLEINRREIKTRRVIEEISSLPVSDSKDKERTEIKLFCLENCLRELSAEDKKFVLAYYQGEKTEKIKNRQKLQNEFNLSGSGFRMKALRLRERLETCVRSCFREREK